MHTLAAAQHPPRGRTVLIRVAILALLLAAGAAVAYRVGLFDYRHAAERIARLDETHGGFGFIVGFVVVYGLTTALGAPGLPFTLAGGALFGTVRGTALSWAGAMVGSACGYWIARSLARDVVQSAAQRSPRVCAAIEQGRDFGGMLRLRLIPVLPLGVVNFAGGLAKAPFGRYMAASAIGVIPTTIIYCYLAASVIEGVSTQNHAVRTGIVAAVLVIGISLVPRLVKRIERIGVRPL